MFNKYSIKYCFNDEPTRTVYEEIVGAEDEAEARSFIVKFKGDGRWLHIISVKKIGTSFDDFDLCEEARESLAKGFAVVGTEGLDTVKYFPDGHKEIIGHVKT